MDKILQKWGNSISEGQRQGDWSGPAFLRAFSSTGKVVTLLSSLEVSKISFSFSQNHREISSVKWLLLKKSWATDQAAEQQDGQLSPVLCSQYLWRCYIWLNTKPKFMKTDKYLEMSKHKRNSTPVTTLKRYDHEYRDTGNSRKLFYIFYLFQRSRA